MLKLFATATILAGAVLLSAPNVQAMPLAPAASDGLVTQIAGGCGRGFHRGPHGGCVRNYARPWRHACPRGYHMGPRGRCRASW
jgi:hypothetical protein